MGIERMTSIEVSGGAEKLDDVLETCLSSGVFHPENAAKLSEYSIGTSSLLRNPYSGLLVKLSEIDAQLKIGLRYEDYSDLALGWESRAAFVEQAHEYLNILLEEYPKYFDKKNKINDEINSYNAAINMLSKVQTPDINFDKLFSGAFVKVRFGKLPDRGLEKLDVYKEDKPYALYKLSSDLGRTWIIYITANQFVEEVDRLFKDIGFVRLRIPDYVHGTASDAITYVRDGLAKERAASEKATREIDDFVRREQRRFLQIYSRTKFMNDAYDLRRYAVTVRGVFHVVGFVTTRDMDTLIEPLEAIRDIALEVRPAGDDERLKIPVRLRNNWFVRPFEMFVTMYGSPSYNDIDPSPFVAWTYSILFGIMFGDLGQGLLIALLGCFLSRYKKMALGGIMTRIGVASCVFGTLYGSVFGYEHWLDPVFHVLGFAEKPIHVMDPSMTNTLLIAAIGLGAAIILMVIVFNICIGIKRKDFERVVLSHNGFAGLIFYSAALFAAASAVLGKDVLTPVYVICLFVVPLLTIFLKDPITRIIHLQTKDTILHKDAELVGSTIFKRVDTDISEIFTTKFVTARFGRIPMDSYTKLQFYMEAPFMLYPLKSDTDYIWCIYAMAASDKHQIDAIFHDLYFERIYIPASELESNEKAEAFIRSCIDRGDTPIVNEAVADTPAKRRKSIMARIFPEGFSNFFVESFFEMFEILLSFVTNTMSFLRVGGFILSHAGMMSVVMTLSEMVGAGASPVVVIFGNLFVMALEGLIVGIQCLRLEFYEMFSRYFDAEGVEFTPVRASFQVQAG